MIELYINGMSVDVMPNDGITLQYRSNWFGDIKEISSSNSLTIRLPLTPKNNLAFGFVAYADSGVNRDNLLSAVLVVDGVEVVRGEAALISASRESYEVSLVWGNFVALRKWVDGELSLTDLTFSGSFEYKPKSELTLYPSSAAAPAFGYIDYYSGGNYINPSFNCGNVFYAIIEQNKLPIDLSKADITPLYEIYMPVVTDLSKLDTPTGVISAIDVMPEINQLDFFMAMCRIMGLFLIAKPNGELALLNFDALKDRSRAIDWSGKAASIGELPDSTNYEIDGYAAQRNWMRYTEDDKDSISRNGYADYFFLSGGSSKPLEDTIYTMPFTIYGSLIQYANGEFVKFKNTLKTLSRKGQYLSFDELARPLFFETLIQNKYKYFQDVLRYPEVLTVNLALTPFDLQGLDYTRPIYLSRYGCFFAIVEITNDGWLSEAQLLKLI